MKRDIIKCNCRPCNHSFVYEIGSAKPPTCPLCEKTLVTKGQSVVKTGKNATCLKCGTIFTPPNNIHPASLVCAAACTVQKNF